MADDTMFAEAVAATKAGETARARDLLARLLRADNNNPDYWLWMSAVVESERESVYCLRSVTKLRPGHPAARLGLTALGQISLAAERTGPVRQQRASAFPHQSAGRINSMADWWKVSRNRENAIIAFLGLCVAVLMVVIVTSQVQINLSNFQTGILQPTGSPSASANNGTPSAIAQTAEFSVTLIRTGTPSGLVALATYVGRPQTATPYYGVTPKSPSGAFDVALSTYQSGDLTKALSLFQQLAQQQPTSPQVFYFLGEVNLKLRRMKDSLEAYSKAVALDPKYPLGHLGLAVWHRTDNKNSEYLDELNTALTLDPKLIDAYIERAFYYSWRRDWVKARDDLEAAVRLDSNHALALIRLGRAQLHTNQFNEALVNILRAQILDPTILEGYLGMGEAFYSLKLYALAVSPLNTYTAYDSENIDGWVLYCEALTGAGNYSQAIKAGKRALDLDINYVPAHMALGDAYRMSGEYSLAAEDYRVASEREPFSFETNFQYGRALLLARKPDKAIRVLSTARGLAKTVEQTADALGWQALALEAFGDPKAKEVWSELMNLKGAPESWVTMAYLHYYGFLTPTPVPSTESTSESGTSTPAGTPSVTATGSAKPSSAASVTPTPTP